MDADGAAGGLHEATRTDDGKQWRQWSLFHLVIEAFLIASDDIHERMGLKVVLVPIFFTKIWMQCMLLQTVSDIIVA